VSGIQRARQAGAEQRDRPPGGSGPPSWAAAALLDSLHEGCFVCDEAGSVVQINAAFTQILGFGPDGLPYPVEHPWWPPADTDPDGHRQVTEAVARLRRDGGGHCTAPARHRDGHKLWLSASVGEVRDPVTGHRAVVGTIWDVTAEHDAGQRDATVALQRDLLGPARPPAGFAARYVPASPPLEVGGDWYDLVELPGSRIGIVVGGCAGHGLAAATVMGQVRSACRALLLQDAGPARVLAVLDRFAALVPGALRTTVFCAVLDPGTGQLRYSSAGHPPGILAHPGGRTQLLDGGSAAPLTDPPGAPRREASCTLPGRSALLLYTGGLVERCRVPLGERIGQAAAALHQAGEAGADDLALQVMGGMAPPGGYDDDVALVAYRHPGPLNLAFPAEPTQLAPVRAALRGWLGRCGVGRRAVQDILVAAGEACANAIEHGHRNTAGQHIRLRAEATVTRLRLTITDAGRWKAAQPPPNPFRGRGLTLMRALMEQVSIEPGTGGAGTTVHMQLRIAP